MAVLYGLNKFRPFVSGVRVIVRTDAENIRWCLSQSKGMLARWGLKLMEFGIEFQHRKNVHHQNADGLSRSPVDPPSPEAEFRSFNAGLVASIQQSSPTVTPIVIDAECTTVDYEQLKEAYASDALASTYLPFKDVAFPEAKYVWLDNLLVENVGTKVGVPRIYVPETLRRGLLEAHHRSPFAAHHGIFKTTRHVLRYYTWPGVTEDIKRYIGECQECQRINPGRERRQGLLKPYVVTRRGQLVAMDYFGPLPSTRNRKVYVLVIVDHLTKFIVATATTTNTAEETVRAMHSAFCQFGFPEALLSDNGPHFVANLAREYSATFGIRKKFTSVYHPSADPLAEAWMKVLRKSVLTLGRTTPLSWVPSIVAAYNSSTHPSLGCSPFFALFGREMSLPTSEMRDEDGPHNRLRATIDFVEGRLATQLLLVATEAVRRMDRDRTDTEVRVGNLVFVRNRHPRKADFPWSTPCEVVETSSSGVACRVRPLPGRAEAVPPESSWVNVKDIRIWRIRPAVWKQATGSTAAASSSTAAPSASSAAASTSASAAPSAASAAAATAAAPARRRDALAVRPNTFPALRRARLQERLACLRSPGVGSVVAGLKESVPPDPRVDVVTDSPSSHSFSPLFSRRSTPANPAPAIVISSGGSASSTVTTPPTPASDVTWTPGSSFDELSR